MIQLETRRDESQERPADTDLLKCSRCGNGLAHVSLTVGSYIQIRCHHSIKRGDKWTTCGWVNKAWPTR